MDLAAPYRAVIPSLDGPVLRVLAGAHRPLSGLQIHRLAGTGSTNGVRKVLARLAEHGLVSVTRAGAALMYDANRAHLAWPAVEQPIDMPNELNAGCAPPSPPGAWRRCAWACSAPQRVATAPPAAMSTSSSSIPTATVRATPRGLEGAQRRTATWEQQVQELRQSVLSMTGNHAHVLELSMAALQDTLAHGEPIVAEWKRDLVLISGDPPWAVIASLTSSGRAAIEVER